MKYILTILLFILVAGCLCCGLPMLLLIMWGRANVERERKWWDEQRKKTREDLEKRFREIENKAIKN